MIPKAFPGMSSFKPNPALNFLVLALLVLQKFALAMGQIKLTVVITLPIIHVCLCTTRRSSVSPVGKTGGR